MGWGIPLSKEWLFLLQEMLGMKAARTCFKGLLLQALVFKGVWWFSGCREFKKASGLSSPLASPNFHKHTPSSVGPLSFSSAWVETHYCPTLTLELTALAVAYAPQATPGRFCSLHVSSGSFPSIKEEAGTTSQPQESLHEKKVTQQEMCPHTTLT